MRKCLIIQAYNAEDEEPNYTVIHIGRPVMFQNGEEVRLPEIPSAVFQLSAVAASCFVSELLRSPLYRESVWRSLTATGGLNLQKTYVLKIKLVPPQQNPLDHRL